MGIGGSGAPPLTGPQIEPRINQRLAKTGTYAVIAADRGCVIDCTSGTFSVTLLAAATAGAGFQVTVYNSGSGTITVDPNSSETVRTPSGSSTTATLAQGAGLILMCDGSGWLSVATAAASGGGGGGAGTTGGVDLTTPVSITAITTITSSGKNKSYIVTGTTSAYTITLDTSSGWTAGDMILFEMSTALTKTITLSASAKIDNSTTRIMHDGESCTLHWDGSTFHKIAGKTIPYQCKIVNTGAQSIADSSLAVVVLNSAPIDPHLMADTTNYRIILYRQSKYLITGKLRFDYDTPDITSSYIVLRRNGGGGEFDETWGATTSNDVLLSLACSSHASPSVTSGSTYIDMTVSQTSGGSRNTNGVYDSFASLSVIEIPDW